MAVPNPPQKLGPGERRELKNHCRERTGPRGTELKTDKRGWWQRFRLQGLRDQEDTVPVLQASCAVGHRH